MSEQGSIRPSYTMAFRLAALVALSTAIYHYAAFFYPALGKIYGAAYNPGYPSRRHLVWACIFVSLAGLLIWRPRGLIWPYLILVVEQLKGHGGAIWRHWVQNRFVSWTDLGVVTGELLILLLLVMDWWARRSRTKQDI